MSTTSLLPNRLYIAVDGDYATILVVVDSEGSLVQASNSLRFNHSGSVSGIYYQIEDMILDVKQSDNSIYLLARETLLRFNVDNQGLVDPKYAWKQDG